MSVFLTSNILLFLLLFLPTLGKFDPRTMTEIGYRSLCKETSGALKYGFHKFIKKNLANIKLQKIRQFVVNQERCGHTFLKQVRETSKKYFGSIIYWGNPQRKIQTWSQLVNLLNLLNLLKPKFTHFICSSSKF